MELKQEHTLLLVDDEFSILKSLKRLFRREKYNILTADGGQQALDLLKKADKPVSMIISDQRMPGMNGATFLEKSIDVNPDAIRFLLTGYSDMDAVVNAVNKGKIHRYLTKPWNDHEMVMLVNEYLGNLELKRENARLTELTQRQNRKLAEMNKTLEETVNQRTWALKYQNKMLEKLNCGLEESLMDIVRLLLSLVENSSPRLGHYMKAVGQLIRQTAIRAGMDSAQQDRLEMAGLVHDIGLIGMPDTLLEKDERAMTPEEFETYAQHPEIAALCLSSVKGFQDISEIVRAHHENLDGTGFPGMLQGEDLSKEARILAVVSDYCTILHLWPSGIKRTLATARRYLGHKTVSTLEFNDPNQVRCTVAEKIILEGIGKRYDGTVVNYFLEAIGSESTGKTGHKLAYNLLKTGMILKEDLRLKDGRLLLTSGTVLNYGALQSIQTIGNQGMIQGAISIVAESAEGEKNGHEPPSND